MSPAAAVLWQVVLHSAVAAGVLMVWARHLRLASGPARRRILSVILTLPLLTASMPGRSGYTFRERTAWLDSLRLLEIPLFGGFHLFHLVLLTAGVTAGVTLWQEVIPALRRLHPESAPPSAALLRRVRALSGWGRCRVSVTSQREIFVATVGLPSRPRLVVSQGALEKLSDEELEAVLRHENAHGRPRRWLGTHGLFALRLLQVYNPVALWAFREYTVETEIACDAEAVAGLDPRPLARALLRVYDDTATSDLSARSLLRRRVDILLGRSGDLDPSLSPISVLAAAVVLFLLLPWIV